MTRKKKVAESAPVPKAQESQMQRFVLRRKEDLTGTSGTGVVAEGIRFSNGQAALHWVSQFNSIAVYHSVDIIVAVHGHDGATVLEWVDTDPMAAT